MGKNESSRFKRRVYVDDDGGGGKLLKFLLKSRNVFEDNEFALIQAKRWWEWKKPSLEFEIKYADEEYSGSNSNFEYCPVGSIEFCLANFPGRPKPLNLPSCFTDYDFAGRIVMTEEDILKALAKNDSMSVYVKSADTFKHPANGFYKAAEIITEVELIFGSDKIQISTDINKIEQIHANNKYASRELVSEWRCFVFRKKLVDLKHYSGNVFSVPNKDKILRLISVFEDSPIAYTLDVYTTKFGNGRIETYAMEVHDFFGCGLYGFDRPDLYPFMCSQWFSEWKRKNGIFCGKEMKNENT